MGRALSRDLRAVSLQLLKAGYRADDWRNGSESARCAFLINHRFRERRSLLGRHCSAEKRGIGPGQAGPTAIDPRIYDTYTKRIFGVWGSSYGLG